MKSLSLTMNRLARWSPRIAGALSRRDGLSSRRRANPPTGAKTDFSDFPPRSQRVSQAGCASRQTSSITRDIFHARLTCPSQTNRSIGQTTFRNYSISTTQLPDGMWVAAFGRLDGEMMQGKDRKCAILETAPHPAEVIAIADAQIRIEERAAA